MEEPWLDLKGILGYSHIIFSCIGLILNFLLLFLILTKTPKRLQDYRRVLLQNCLVDLFYNIVQFVCKTATDYKNGNFLQIYTNDFGLFSPEYASIFDFIWVLALYCTLVFLPVQFVYRYFLIVKNLKLSNLQYFFMCMTSLFFASSYSGYSVYVLWPRESQFSEALKLLTDDPFYFRERPNFSTANIRDWPMFTMFLYSYSLTATSYTVIIWSSYAVWKHLKRMESHMSTQIKDVNQQITRTLIMQATIPVFVLFVPIGCTVTMVFLKANVRGFGLIISFFFAWIPITNTLVTIFVVKSYRSAVIQFFQRIFQGFQVIPTQVSTVSSSHIKNTLAP